jgi:hypothetical protein
LIGSSYGNDNIPARQKNGADGPERLAFGT